MVDHIIIILSEWGVLPAWCVYVSVAEQFRHKSPRHQTHMVFFRIIIELN